MYHKFKEDTTEQVYELRCAEQLLTIRNKTQILCLYSNQIYFAYNYIHYMFWPTRAILRWTPYHVIIRKVYVVAIEAKYLCFISDV
jgi:hypothetical protein